MYPQASTDGTTARGVASSPSFPEVENRVLAYWAADGTFEESVRRREAGTDGANEFVFYDGPPFANGLPHYGHLLTGYVKDVVPRYQTMRGHRVERRFGWDTHGLPAELEAQRQLGITDKAQVLELGIARFNEVCRESVLRYTQEWEEYVTRQARWVDFENDYKTLDLTYMESVMWAFRTLYDKGLVYEGFRVLPYCWRDETPLSAHELRMDAEVYQQRQDPAVTVWVELETGERMMAWTTTPWTLPTNAAMAVGPDIDYVVVEHDGARWLLAEARLGAYARDLGLLGDDGAVVDGDALAAAVAARVRGSDLVGRRYAPLFDYFTDVERFGTQNAFQVIASDHVTTEDGTGVVHMAPAYGEDDQRASDAAGIPTILSVDARARFTSLVPDYEGLQVFEANPAIVRDLRATGHVVRQDSYVHSYPHCWRCRTPLIYRAVSSWFVEVTKVRDRMVELNEQITWVPAHVKNGQFGKWLAGARDWSISRNRFWGSPIPVWRSDDDAYPRVDVYGSLDELARDFGVRPDDLHRPFVDDLARPNPDDPTGRSMMRRVPDVLDVWFDSGAMSFAQVHYPFENAEWFSRHFPADFIVEYIGQTRGWFYTLHVLATALFDRPAFSAGMSHGIVLGSDGQKMSKSLRNYPDVRDVFDRDGADAMRWFLMASPILRGGNLIVTEQGIRDGVRQVLIPLWSTWYFFALYANAFRGDESGGTSGGTSGGPPGGTSGGAYRARWSTASEHVLDRYLLALTGSLVRDVEAAMDALDIAAACDLVREHVDALTNWYIRRSRQRFWDEDTDAFDTLYTALEVLTRVAAPLAPLVTEEIWRGLTGGRSVHLTDWPVAGDLPQAPELVRSMGRVRTAVSTALALRKAAGLRVRLPLPSVTVVTDDAADLADLADLVAQEVNVAEVRLLDIADVGESDFGITRRLVVNARAAGPRLGKDVQRAIRASKSGDWATADDGTVTAGGIALVEGEFTVETVVGDGASATGGSQSVGVLPGGGFVVLDTEVTPELAAAGLAADVVRVVQQARRDAGLELCTRIRLTVTGEGPVWEAVVAHQHLLMTETLADAVGASGELEHLPAGDGVVEALVGDGHRVRVRLDRA